METRLLAAVTSVSQPILGPITYPHLSSTIGTVALQDTCIPYFIGNGIPGVRVRLCNG
jgi:hypothetical protein